MWLKVFLLLVYILLLFILSRVLEALSWYENGFSGMLSRKLLDPMVLSVAKLRALLEQRGLSYDGVVEKSELTSLIESSGPVNTEEVVMAQSESAESAETNFTCGAHFIEQVEDAKDSVWLVQVVRHSGQLHIVGDMRWKAIRKKVKKFGVRTGLLDCSLDHRYCAQKGWHSPFLLLALPREFEKKASIAMHNYSGPVHETVVLRWVRDKLAERVMHIKDPTSFRRNWQNFTNGPLDPEIRVVLFTALRSPPLFYSALTVKFPGRVKFGMVSLKSSTERTLWKQILDNYPVPSYVIYSSEGNYTYGSKYGEQFSFASMEQSLKFLYPCLNDIFIISFCAANFSSLFEFFVSNCRIFRRLTKCAWCIIKYNIILIMLWLPIMGIFQMPLLDRMPLIALKLERMFSISELGTVFRGDYSFFQNHPVYIYLSFLIYLVSVTHLCRKFRQEEDETEGWFNFSHSAHFVHLRPNNLLEPMGLSGYDFLGRLDVFGSRLGQQSLWLQPAISSDYIQHLPTWRFCPAPLGEKALQNVAKVEMAMGISKDSATPHDCAQNSQKQPVGSKEPLDQSSGSDQRGPSKTSDAILQSTEASQGPLHQRLPLESNVPRDIASPTSLEQQMRPEAHCHAHPQGAPTSQGCCSSHQANANTVETPSHQSSASSISLPSSLSSSEMNVDSPNESLSSPIQDRMSACGSSSSVTSRRTLGFPPGFIESHQCVICLDEYVPSVMLCGLPCGHVFHENCVFTWLNTEKHFCPMCRWPSYQPVAMLS